MSSSRDDPRINLALASAALQKGLGYLPNPGEFNAPKTFRGDSKKLEEFLQQVEKLISFHNLATDVDKVVALFSYLGGEARSFCRVHPAYKANIYKNLVAALR
ncbi:hypothetical protein CF319_g8536 [Tilletia indica]|nr:hypothetical protein CF319_g8536 [Tilletia indica]